MTRTYWNTSNGRMERSVRASLASGVLDDMDAAAADTALSLAVLADQMMRSQPDTMFGDTKFAYHLRMVLSELGKSLDRCLLSPQSRLAVASASPVADPFTAVLADVHSIMRD